MKRAVSHLAAAAIVLLAAVPAISAEPSPAPPPDESFYAKSLHYTNRGIEYVYSKEAGGLERITGMSAKDLGCMKSTCHVRNCDTCHRKDVDGKPTFTTDREVIHAACQKCHPVEKDDPDVHVRRGMRCMDCHTAREIHGDGIAHDTYMKPGVLEARCGTCHGDISRTASHTRHGGRLDCAACHVRDFPTCFNCHIDTALAKGKESSIKLDGMLFLVNHGGKVKPANFLSYVYGNKTMITLAPSFPHSVKKEGRKCPECHGTENVREAGSGGLVLAKWEDGRLKGAQGVIPVVDGMRWNLAFLGREGEKWVPLRDPEAPLVNFAGACSPLTREQLAKLEKARTPA